MSKSNATATVNQGGVGFVGLLTLLFAAAKIFGYIDWSWWAVFAPVLIGFGVGMLCLILVLVIAVLQAK